MLRAADYVDWLRDQHGRDSWGRPRDLTWAFNKPLPAPGQFHVGHWSTRCTLCPAALHLGGGATLLNHLCPPHQGQALARSRRIARLRFAAVNIQLWWRAWLEANRVPESRGKRWWVIDP